MKHFIFGLVLRSAALLLFSEYLVNRIEFNTPINSYHRLREAAFLFRQDPKSAFQTDLVSHSPLLVFFFSVFGDHIYSLTIILADLVIAKCIGSIANSYRLSLVYLYCPISILSCASKSTTSIGLCLFCIALTEASKGHRHRAILAAILAGSINLWFFALIPSLFTLMGVNSIEEPIFGLCCLLGILRFGCQCWPIRPYLNMLRLNELVPNYGIWWYFFAEIFEDSRLFYSFVFGIHAVIYVAPVLLRFREELLFANIMIFALVAVFQPYPTLSDHLVAILLLCSNKHLIQHLRQGPMLSATLFLTLIISPVVYHIWISLGSGNANFFYAFGLAYNFALISLISDFCFAMLKYKYHQSNPELPKDVPVAQIYQ